MKWYLILEWIRIKVYFPKKDQYLEKPCMMNCLLPVDPKHHSWKGKVLPSTCYERDSTSKREVTEGEVGLDIGIRLLQPFQIRGHD